MVARALFRPSAKPGQSSNQAVTSSDQSVKITSRQAAAPRQIIYGKTRVGGVYGLIHSTLDNQLLHVIYLVAGHEVAGFDGVLINDQLVTIDGSGNVTSGDYAGYIHFEFFTGTPTQAACATLMAQAPEIWTSNHRLRGIAYVYALFTWNPSAPPGQFQTIGAKTFASGLPNVSFIVRGKKVYDPRSGLTAYSNNPALCVADYLMDTTYGLGVPSAEIDSTYLTSAANSCDESVSLAQGGTEHRYECNGAVLSSAEPQEILGKLLASMHGKCPYDGEKWYIQAGVYQSPTLTFTDDDLRAGMTVQTITSRRDLFNTVRGTYVEPSKLYQEYDFAPVISSAGVTAMGRTVVKDMALPFTTSGSMAQRIAKIDLLKAQLQISVEAPCKLTAWRCMAGDTILWTSARWGWVAKPFEVTRAQFALDRDKEGNPVLAVNLSLREIASSCYSWSASEQNVRDDSPATTLPDIRNVLPPSSLTVTETLYATLASTGVKTRADLAWTASADAFVVAYQPEYKLRADSTWTVLPRVNGLATTVADLAAGSYDFRVAAVNYPGIMSPYVTTTQEIAGLSAPPADPAGFGGSAIGGTALLRWTQSGDLDVRIGGVAVFRHSSATSGATWATATPIGDAVPGAGTETSLPLKSGTYLMKFRDSSGNFSVNAASWVTEQVALKAFTNVATLTEDPTFGGSKTNCTVVSSKLRLTAGNATGSYAWHATMDLGSVKSVRVTVGITAQVINSTDSWDSTELCDSAESWDMVVSGNEVQAVTYVRKTNDDPAGSPTWTPWVRIDAAEFSARAFQFRTDFVASDLSYSMDISALAAVAETSA
ncbi:MAG: phage tail protein [Reyranellaceae bacterium]